jgi:hypothetical protein
MPWTFYNSSGQKLSTAATSIDVLDIDGATDIGADIVDADLFIIDDGAGGTNRKTAASRIKTYIGTAAVIREGGQLTEATTTSTSVVDLLTASSLTVLAAQFFYGTNRARKTAGATTAAGASVKLNSTAMDTAAVAAGRTANLAGGFNNTNEAQTAGPLWQVPATVTNYAFGSCWGEYALNNSGGGIATRQTIVSGGGDRPTATITDVVLTGITTSSVTLGLDELNVYSLGTS